MKEIRKLTKIKRTIHGGGKKTYKKKIEPSMKKVRKLTKIKRTIHEGGKKTYKERKL